MVAKEPFESFATVNREGGTTIILTTHDPVISSISARPDHGRSRARRSTTAPSGVARGARLEPALALEFETDPGVSSSAARTR